MGTGRASKGSFIFFLILSYMMSSGSGVTELSVAVSASEGSGSGGGGLKSLLDGTPLLTTTTTPKTSV